MAGVDIDPFEEHKLRTDKPTGERVELPEIPRGATWEPEREQETAYRGALLRARAILNAAFVKDKVNELYEILSEHFPKNQDVIYYDDFEVKSGELFYEGRDETLTKKGRLRLFKTLKRLLGKNRVYNLGLDVSEWLTSKRAAALNKAQEELPSV